MDIINKPIGYILKFCNSLMGNQYILALLLFALIVEIVLLPFGIKQQKTQIKQAKLRPKENAIRKKYAGRDDQATKQKMTMEIQEMYQKEGYNPLGGCLPLLIQLPILIALYNIVMNPLYYICNLSSSAIDQISTIVSSHTGASYDAARNINLLGDMKLLSFSDFAHVEGMTRELFDNLPNLSLFGGALDLAKTPAFTSFDLLLLVPLITFISYFFSMKLTRKLSYQPATVDKATGCSNNLMDFMMPAFSVYITFVVPAAIGVYWIFKCLLGIIKQVVLKYAMPLPVFTEEDYLAAEKELAGKAQKEKKAPSGRVVRSLHHIDDEDFADTAEAGRARREALEAQAAEDAKLKAASGKASLLGGTRMKNDEKKTENTEKAPEDNDADKGND